MRILHLQFVDDTLVICKDSREQVANLSLLLLWFEVALGLNMNLEKNSMMLVGSVEVWMSRYLSLWLSCVCGWGSS